MALSPQAAFQANGAFQLAENMGFQTQLFGIWNPIEPSVPDGWVPTPPSSGIWVPTTPPTGVWTPTGL